MKIVPHKVQKHVNTNDLYPIGCGILTVAGGSGKKTEVVLQVILTICVYRKRRNKLCVYYLFD